MVVNEDVVNPRLILVTSLALMDTFKTISNMVFSCNSGFATAKNRSRGNK
jgi:hypothetical protein